MDMVKQGKRGLSLLMAFVLVFGLLPAGFASAQVPDNSAAGRTRPYDGVDFESMISDHSGIYYGAYDHAVDYIRDGGGFWNGSDYVHDGVTRPILWRAMGEDRNTYDEDSETITVLSEYVLDGQAFNASRYDEEEANYYVGSAMEEWLDDTVQTAFSGQEQDGMAGADVVTGKYDQAGCEIEDNDFPQETYQQLYLPWGNVPQYNAPEIYWSAGNEADAAYEITDTGATFKGGVELDTAAGWQLRTPVYSDPNAVIGVWGVPGNDTETGNVPVNRPAGVRPLFQLDPTRVIFASEILANTTGRADATQADANYSAAAGGGKNFKLTVTSSQLRLDNLTTAAGLQVLNSTTLTVAPGADLALKGTATGNGNSVNYKIVADTAADRTIVGYGAAAADAEGSPQALTVPLKNLAGDDLAPGYYTVYIWEQLSKEKNSDEGSVPLSFRLKVWEPDPDADAFQIWNWDDLSQVMYQQEYNGVTKFELMQDLGIPKQTDTYGKGALSGRSGSEKFGWYGYQGYTGAEGDFSTGTKGSGSGWDGGRGWIPLGSSYSEYEDEDEEYDDKTMQMPFMGMFDGRGHTISGLWIDKQTVTNETGLFGYAEGAEIRNLSVALASAGVNGNHMTGALAGGVSGSGVENCHVLGGSVSGGQQQTMIGGLLGFAENSTIADSSAQAAVTGDWHLGGLVGYALDVSIQGCYATGNVTGNPGIIEATEIGGFIGTLSGFYDINGCFATGAVSGNYVLGGFIGRINAGADDPRDGITANGMFSIQNSYSMGKVTVNGTLAQNVSGFIGHFWGNGGIATIENCYATGDVRIEATARENWDGNQETMAGFVGGSWGGPAELRIANSYYAGTITAAEPDLFEILAFVGRQETWWGDWETGAENIGYVINNCYYDVTKNAGLDAAGTNVTADGITGKTTAQMTGTSMPGLLSSGVFVYRAPEGKFSFYPQLKRFAPTTGLLGSSSWSLSEMLSVESVKVGEGGSGGNPGNPGNPGEPNDPHDPPEPTDPPEPPDPDAYQIWNWADLADVINQVTGGGKTKFALMQDLGVPNEGNYGDGTGSGRDGDDKYGWYGYQGFTGDEADYTGTKGSGAGWQGTAGWFPIGEQTKPFTGSFDGRGHTISGLWINGPSGVGVGLFGYVTGVDTGDGEPTEIKNLNLSIAGEVKGDFKVGGLVGMLNGYDGESYIENCHVLDGAVSGGEVVGGLVGHVLYAELNEVSSQAAVSGDSMLGGLVGFAEGNLYVQSSYATGDVAGVTDAIGGLVGEVQLNSSGLDLEACFATGDVRGSAELGGLVGVIHGEGSGNIANSYAMGNVTAAGGEVFGVGGLVGFVEGDLYLYVYYCYARGDVTVQSGTVSAYEPDSIAGLVGGSAGSGPGRGASIYGAYYSGTVTAGGAFTPRAFIGSQGNADPESPSGFYDSTKNPGLAPAGAGVDDETITGKSTTAMTGAAFVSDNGDDGTLYGDDVFVHRAPEGSFAFYPQLVLFAPTAGKLGNNTWSLTEALSIESVKVG
ncbi:MAG: DUF6273 domain-containing protein, partial [Peptococcaceae bacterium]|nr:DUF6273 domain-containing protein [Peptococcaceae bacterium]